MCHHESEFQCQSDGSCVPSTWECDGHPDCEDGSDEHHACPPRTCPSSMFRCDNGNCVLRSWICDGDNDCRDMSDERDCPTPPFRCPSWQWQCPGHSVCINLTTVCDNTPDCPNGADESPLCSKSDLCLPSQPATSSWSIRKIWLFYYISMFAGLLKFNFVLISHDDRGSNSDLIWFYLTFFYYWYSVNKGDFTSIVGCYVFVFGFLRLNHACVWFEWH